MMSTSTFVISDKNTTMDFWLKLGKNLWKIISGVIISIAATAATGAIVNLVSNYIFRQNCGTGQVPNSDRISCMPCLASQFVQGGITCQNCPNPGEIPTLDRLMCTPCQPDEITQTGMCLNCTIPGEVPNPDKTECIPCPLTQIAVNGQCQNCPVGQAPNDDRISCYVEIRCPDDCTSPDQGDCDKRTGTCNCKIGFVCSNCGKQIIRIYIICA